MNHATQTPDASSGRSHVKDWEQILEETTIVRGEVLTNDGALRVGLEYLRLDAPRGLIHLSALILLPLMIFAVVTTHEGRFGRGSVTRVIGQPFGGITRVVEDPKALDGETVRGMSFLGDTMVWPFVLLIPLLFVLLNVVIDRFVMFFRSSRRILSQQWVVEHEAEYREVVDRVRRIVRAEGAWRFVKIAAITVSIAFFLWNTGVCTFADRFKPYKTSRPYVEKESGHFVQKDLEAQGRPPIPVPKWDTDIRNAPLSWLSARLWVLLMGYVWIPLIIYKLFSLVSATYVYTDALSKTEHSALDIKPLSPDNAGGLSRLSSLAIALTYPMVVVGLMMVMPFYKENTSPSLHNTLMFIPFMPIFLAMFFMPLLGVHRAMAAAKEQYLEEFATLFERVHDTFVKEVRSPSLDLAEFSRLEISMRGLAESYEKISRMPVWPVGVSTLYRLFTAVLIPVLVPILIETLIRRLLP